MLYVRCFSRDICIRNEINNPIGMKADARWLVRDWGTQNGNGNGWNWWWNWLTTSRTHLTRNNIHYLFKLIILLLIASAILPVYHAIIGSNIT